MELRKFSHVMHLVSLVEGELRDVKNAWDALFSCFPAGTLSGAPKIRAMQIISKLEEKRRGFYGGAIVAADFAGNLDSCIAIRSLSYEKGKVRIQAGAGIVSDSQAEREFQEILDKTKTVRMAIAQAESS
jgi:anthranilate synthase component 1